MFSFDNDVQLRLELADFIEQIARETFDFFQYTLIVHSDIELNISAVERAAGVNTLQNYIESNAWYSPNTIIITIYPFIIINSFSLLEHYKSNKFDEIKTVIIYITLHEMVHSQQEVDNNLYHQSSTYREFIESSCDYRAASLIGCNVDTLMKTFNMTDLNIGIILKHLAGSYTDISTNYRKLQIEDFYITILTPITKSITNNISDFIYRSRIMIIEITGPEIRITNRYYAKLDGEMMEPDLGLLEALRFYDRCYECTFDASINTSNPIDDDIIGITLIKIDLRNMHTKGLIKYDKTDYNGKNERKLISPLIKYDNEDRS